MIKKYSKDLGDINYIRPVCSNGWKRIRLIRAEADQYINNEKQWKFMEQGKFSMKLTWKHVIAQDNFSIEKFKYIWHKNIPAKITLFCWRLLHGKLALDDNIQKIGIALASKCVCCREGNIENQDHLFVQREAARIVWKFFKQKIGMRSNTFNTVSTLMSLWRKTNKKSPATIIFHILPMIIMWELWKARNKKIHESVNMETEEIIRSIQRQIELIYGAYQGNFNRGDVKEAIRDILKDR